MIVRPLILVTRETKILQNYFMFRRRSLK